MSDILSKASALETDVVGFLCDMIGFPSTSGNEGDVILRIKKEMEDIGFDEVRVDGLGNLLGRIGSGARVLVIDGHCDVVDAGNRDLWETDPFEAVVRDGLIYGRGSCDQKSGVASAVYAGRILKEIGLPEDVTLWVTVTILEEDIEGLAWKYLVEEEKLRPDAVLITEPTNLNIYRGHRGRVEIEIKTEGISCHGSAPERGVNAIYKMAPIIKEIESLHPRLKDDAFLGKGSVTISEVRSTAPSLCAVADSCTIHLDRRLTAGETIESSLEEIRALPAFREADATVWVPEYQVSSYTGMKYPMLKYCPTWVLDEDHDLLIRAGEGFHRLFGEKPKVDKWTFSTNGVGSMGMFQIPTFGFGPGNEVYAHAPNEFVPVDHLVRAMAFYAEYVTRF